jgi:hypothetical protein
MKNDKQLRFKKVATYRTNQIIKYLNLLSNCSNKNNYEYDQLDVNKIFYAIDDALRETKINFKSKKKNNFEL